MITKKELTDRFSTIEINSNEIELMTSHTVYEKNEDKKDLLYPDYSGMSTRGYLGTVTFDKKNKNILKIKGGFVEGTVMSVEQLMGFGELPSKDALVAQVLGTFLAPISSLAFVLDQIRIQKEGPAAEPAAE